MSEYLLLYSGGKMPEPDEEMAETMKAWAEWREGLGERLKDGGNPFTPGAVTVSENGSITDGPVGTMATGYSIIDASSLHEAGEIAAGCPVLTGGAKITVYETFQVM